MNLWMRKILPISAATVSTKSVEKVPSLVLGVGTMTKLTSEFITAYSVSLVAEIFSLYLLISSFTPGS